MQRWILAAVVVLAGALVGLVVLLGTRDRQPNNVADAPARESPRADVLANVPAPFLEASSAVLRVHVTTEVDGQPLAGARVQAHVQGKPTIAQLAPLTRDSRGRAQHTGRDGIAELALDPGIDYLIFAGLDDRPDLQRQFVALEPPLAGDEVRTVSIALPADTERQRQRDSPAKPDVRVHARVVDRETGAPIRGARVGRSVGWTTSALDDERRTDDDGRFVIESASQRQIFRLIASGYEPACVAPVTGHATPERALEIALSRASSARVTVVDSNGTPIPGLDASLETALFRFGRPDAHALLDAGGIGNATYRVRTDERGVAVFADLPPRMPLTGWLERGRHEMFRAPELMLAPGEAREVTWRVGGGCVLRGVAFEANGKPAAGLAIALESSWSAKPRYFDSGLSRERRHALTDRDGRFAFGDVDPGDWWIGPASEDPDRGVGPRDAAPYARVVSVPREARNVDVEIRVQRGLVISGRVLDPAGSPVMFATIEFTRTTEELRGHGLTNNYGDGRFVLGPVESGEYELRASAVGFVTSEPLAARAGDTDVALRLRPGGTIDGLVVEKPTGGPAAARLVVATRAPAERVVSVSYTEANGALRLNGLAPGVYDLGASTTGGLVGVARDVEVAVGAKRTVRLELEPGARVRVHFEGPWPHCGVSVLLGDALTTTDSIVKGTEQTLLSPAGSVVVRLRSYVEQKDFDLPLTLAVGETRDVTFDGTWK